VEARLFKMDERWEVVMGISKKENQIEQRKKRKKKKSDCASQSKPFGGQT